MILLKIGILLSFHINFTGLMKDADKLKLMLLAWNYQNSNAGKNLTKKKKFI